MSSSNLTRVLEIHQSGPLAKSQELASRLAAIVVALLIGQFIIWLWKRHHQHQTFKRMKVPGPKPNLIHGHLYESRREPYVEFAHKLHQKFGRTLGVYLGGDPYLLTKDLELIQQVFVARSRQFFDRMNFYFNVDPVPDNLICQRGDRWRCMRKLLTPAFSSAKIKSSHFYRDAQQTVSKFMQQLAHNSVLHEDGKEVTLVEDAYDRMAALALDVIVKTAFHMDDMISFSGPLNALKQQDFESQSKNTDKNSNQKTQQQQQVEPADGFLSTLKRAIRLAFNPLVELIFCFPFLDRPLTYLCNQLYFNSIIRLLFERLDYLVVRKPGATSKEADNKPHRRIIDSLIEVLRARKISRSEFTGNAFVIVFAGFETTANALTFTLWLLAKHEPVQRKLRDQLRDSLRKSRLSIELNQRDQEDRELELLATGCPYLEMVINESLRLYPPVPGLACRQASEPVTLSSGLRIERGVNVLPSVFSIQREPQIWGDDAHLFRPERFELLDTCQLNSAMFMPFGLGPRNCIGKALAMHEMKILIGRLLLNYSVHFWPQKTPQKLTLCSPINITITSKDTIPLKFVRLNTNEQ